MVVVFFVLLFISLIWQFIFTHFAKIPVFNGWTIFWEYKYFIGNSEAYTIWNRHKMECNQHWMLLSLRGMWQFGHPRTFFIAQSILFSINVYFRFFFPSSKESIFYCACRQFDSFLKMQHDILRGAEILSSNALYSRFQNCHFHSITKLIPYVWQSKDNFRKSE